MRNPRIRPAKKKQSELYFSASILALALIIPTALAFGDTPEQLEAQIAQLQGQLESRQLRCEATTGSFLSQVFPISHRQLSTAIRTAIASQSPARTAPYGFSLPNTHEQHALSEFLAAVSDAQGRMHEGSDAEVLRIHRAAFRLRSATQMAGAASLRDMLANADRPTVDAIDGIYRRVIGFYSDNINSPDIIALGNTSGAEIYRIECEIARLNRDYFRPLIRERETQLALARNASDRDQTRAVAEVRDGRPVMTDAQAMASADNKTVDLGY